MLHKPMKQQLIITILGADDLGILSGLAAAVSEAGCNILDSRQAIYGQDFCLTMIVEGTIPAIIKAEVLLPKVCQELNLLSLLKRTQHHCRQDLAHLADVEFTGLDAPGVLKQITGFFAKHNITINAFRQNTFVDKLTEANMLKCKMIVNLPKDVAAENLQQAFDDLLDELHLIGNITEKN